VGGASIDPGEDFRYVRGTGGLYLDFTLLPLFTPYVGGGVGAAYIQGASAEVGGIDVEVESDTYLTAHGEVGLALDFLPVISIVPAYRDMWFDTAQGEIDDTTASVQGRRQARILIPLLDQSFGAALFARAAQQA
jgi:opacity protein-like surface antigen